MIVKFIKNGSITLISALKNTFYDLFIQKEHVPDLYKLLAVKESDSFEKIHEKYQIMHKNNSRDMGGSKFIQEKLEEAYKAIKKHKLKLEEK